MGLFEERGEAASGEGQGEPPGPGAGSSPAEPGLTQLCLPTARRSGDFTRRPHAGRGAGTAGSPRGRFGGRRGPSGQGAARLKPPTGPARPRRPGPGTRVAPASPARRSATPRCRVTRVVRPSPRRRRPRGRRLARPPPLGLRAAQPRGLPRRPGRPGPAASRRHVNVEEGGREGPRAGPGRAPPLRIPTTGRRT